MLCSEASLVNNDGDRALIVTLRCRSWGCELCQPVRRWQVCQQAKAGHPTRFITLTVNPAKYSGPEERARRLVDAWRELVKRIKRRYSWSKLPYFAVFEGTKAGEPHLHILVRCGWIDQAWMSQQMSELIDAPIVDIRLVKKPSQVTSYVTKYIGKAPGKFGTCKRYWKTRDYDLEGEPDRLKRPWAKGTWEKSDHDIRHIAGVLIAQGWSVFDYAPGEAVWLSRPQKPPRAPPKAAGLRP